MKRSVAIAIFLPVLWAAGGALASEMPTALPLSRYQAMIDKSPFAPATAPPAPEVAPPTASFAQDLVVKGIAKLGAADFVSIASRDQSHQYSLMTGESGPDGITLTSVTWSDKPGKSQVTLKKGTEFGVVSFDEADFQAGGGQASAPLPPNAPAMQQPGQMAPRIVVNRPFNRAPRMVPPARNAIGRPGNPNVRPFHAPGANFPQQGRIIRPRIIPSTPH